MSNYVTTQESKAVDSINLISLNRQPIDNKEAIRLILNYKNNAGWLLGKTKSIHFDLELLEEVVEFIKQMEINDPTKKGSGARFYVGRYENAQAYPVELRGKRTLVIMPTYKTIPNGNNIDDISVDEVRRLKQEIEGESEIVFTRPYNHGDLCPNNCDGATVVDGLS